jgi:cAMP-dependent protein kinase regulator
MMTWLQNFGGYTSSGLTKDEKKELEQLRIKVKEYREYEKHKNKKEEEEEKSISDDEDSDDIDPSLDNLIEKMPEQKKKQSLLPRSAVSAEAYGDYNKKENFKARYIEKTQEQIQRIKSMIIHSFIFGNLESKDMEIVINAMEEKKYKSGDIIIKQGENGDILYCIEEGECECYKKIENEEKLVKKYQSGDSFGELALLYNSPRAATVKAITDVITWCLDRETFNNIVKDAAQKKREKYENFLKKVDILSTIEPYELMQISDAVKTGNFKKGDYIIKEDEMGDVFYILEEGNCIATKTLEKGKPETKIKDYKEGDYFGERALIKGEPRYANIIAESDNVKVISLDRISFKRLLGPIENILHRNMEKYKIFVQEDKK